MRSRRGFAAAVVFLLLLPVAALYQIVVGAGTEVVIHGALALGAALLSLAVFDFRTPRWVAWTGCAAAALLAVIFLLQGVSDLARNEPLTHLAYQQLGQRVERWLGRVVLLWCLAGWFVDSRGKTRVVGAVAFATVLCAEVVIVMGSQAAGLKALSLLPFVWLLLEAKKAPGEVGR